MKKSNQLRKEIAELEAQAEELKVELANTLDLDKYEELNSKRGSILVKLADLRKDLRLWGESTPGHI